MIYYIKRNLTELKNLKKFKDLHANIEITATQKALFQLVTILLDNALKYFHNIDIGIKSE